MLSERAVNVLVPRQLNIIAKDIMGERDDRRIYIFQNFSNIVHTPWHSILVYLFLRFLQGNLGSSRSYLWLPLEQVFPWTWIDEQCLQYSYRTLSMRVLEHVHSLSLSFHLSQKPSAV